MGRRSRRKTRKYKKVTPGVKVIDHDLSVTPGDGASVNTGNNVSSLHNTSASNVVNLNSNVAPLRVVTPVNVLPQAPVRVVTPVHLTPVSSVANDSIFAPVAGNLSNAANTAPASVDVVLAPEGIGEVGHTLSLILYLQYSLYNKEM